MFNDTPARRLHRLLGVRQWQTKFILNLFDFVWIQLRYRQTFLEIQHQLSGFSVQYIRMLIFFIVGEIVSERFCLTCTHLVIGLVLEWNLSQFAFWKHLFFYKHNIAFWVFCSVEQNSNFFIMGETVSERYI